jgi:membrane protease YdiL (CAAX protease family)
MASESGQGASYDLSSWSEFERENLEFLLHEFQVPVMWKGDRLVVPDSARSVVDGQIEWLTRRTSARAISPSRGVRVKGAHWEPPPFPVAREPEKPLLPPPRASGTSEEGMRGGGIATLGFVGGFGLAISVGVALAVLDADSLLILVVTQAVAWTGLLLACKAVVRRYGNGSLRELGLQGLSRSDVWAGVKSGLLLRFGSAIIGTVIIIIFGSDLGGDPSVSRGIDLDGSAAIAIAIVVFGAPFFEELFFRGLLLSVLTHRLGARRAVFAQAVLFALVHLWPTMSIGQVVLVFSMIVFVGVFLGALRWRSGSLGPPMVSHAVFNAIAVGLVFALD